MRPGPRPGVRVPFEPLRRWLGRGESQSLGQLSELLDVSTMTVRRWADNGINLDVAEELAVRFGEHPNLIWPYFDEIEPFWCWKAVPWLRQWRTQAVLESWRQRLDCVGVAGDLARRMFNETVA